MKPKADLRRNERLPVIPPSQILPTFNMPLNRPIKIIPEVHNFELSKRRRLRPVLKQHSAFHFQNLLGGFIVNGNKHTKTSFEKNCFSAWASTLNMGLINKVDMVCLSPVGYGV